MAEKTKKIQQYKIDAVNQIKEQIQACQDVVFTDFRGLNMLQMTELRRHLRQQNTEYRVVKNNYLKIALSELGLPPADEILVDPTALALIRQDSGAVSKSLFAFSRETPLKVKGGMIGGKVYSADGVEAISRLPAKEVLLAMLMGTMQAPLARLVFGVNELNARLARALQAVADRKANAA
jgi:large subunit ribosomal protein L10